MATIKMAFLLVLFAIACSSILKVRGTEFGMKPSIGCVADYECSSKKEGQCSWAGQDGNCIHGICRCSPPPAQGRKELNPKAVFPYPDENLCVHAGSTILKVRGIEFGMKPSIGCVADYECSSKKEGQCSWARQDGKCIHGICRCPPPPVQERKELDAEVDAAKQHCVCDLDCTKYCPRGCKLMNCLNRTCFCEC